MNRNRFFLLVAVAALAAMALVSCGGGGDGGYPLGPGPTPTPISSVRIVSIDGIDPKSNVRCQDVIDSGKLFLVEFHYVSDQSVIARSFTRETDKLDFDSANTRVNLPPSSQSRRAFVGLTCPFDPNQNMFTCSSSYPKDAAFTTTTIGVKLELLDGKIVDQKEMPCTLTWKRIYN